MITQCIHYTWWRLAWGKQLLIASNPLQFVWDHLSSLLCFSVVALWKPIGWQLMYWLLQSPQPGPRDPATLFSPCLLSISSSFSCVLSYYFPCPFSAIQSIFLDHGVAVCIFQWCYVNLVEVGVGGGQEIVSIRVCLCWRGKRATKRSFYQPCLWRLGWSIFLQKIYILQFLNQDGQSIRTRFDKQNRIGN